MYAKQKLKGKRRNEEKEKEEEQSEKEKRERFLQVYNADDRGKFNEVSVRETFSRYHTLEFLTPANMRLARFRQKMKLRGVVVHLAPFRAGHRIIEQVAETFFTPHPSCEVSATFRDRLINSRPMRS